MAASVLHISDLHLRATLPGDVAAAVHDLVTELGPELVIASGDLTHRGRADQLRAVQMLLASLGVPALAVPGNHDIPYSPLRLVRPWVRFEHTFGTTQPVHRSPSLVAVGLNSVRPWRHQGGRLSHRSLAHAAQELAGAPPHALRVVVCHHHLAGAPWRAGRKFPLTHRDAVLNRLGAAGAELVLGGHIHQSSAVEPHEFLVERDVAHGLPALATSPGLSRPRPHRTGEAQGLHVVAWDDRSLTIETRIWAGHGFAATARRIFPRA